MFVIGYSNVYVISGECARFPIQVNKYFTPGYLVFTTPGAPEDRPDGTDTNSWRFDHWTVDLDFSEVAGGSSSADHDIYWAQKETSYTCTEEMWSAFKAAAGIV